MSVSFVAAGSLGANGTVTSQSITSPACSVGDLLVAVLMDQTAVSNTISPPDGTWTTVTQGKAGSVDVQYGIFWRTATGSGDSFTFTKATDDNLAFGGVIMAFNGHNLAKPLDTTAVGILANTVSADVVTFPAFDPTGTDSHIIFAAFYTDDSTTFDTAMSSDTNPDCTTRFDVETGVGGGSGFSIAVTSGDTTDGSSIASRTWASNSSVDRASVGIVFALQTPQSISITDTEVLSDSISAIRSIILAIIQDTITSTDTITATISRAWTNAVKSVSNWINQNKS